METTIKALLDKGQIDQNVCDHLLRWVGLGRDHKEIQALIDSRDFDEINDAFYDDIPFGTGGRRGKMGPGPNRINRYTIMDSAQGIVDYLREAYPDRSDFSAVIAYDTRNFSREFAQAVASSFAANDLKVHLYKSFRSTPQLSFSVRHLKTDVGIMISASHNPPTDNGIKVYQGDGGQVVPPHDKGIIAKVQLVKEAKTMDFDRAFEEGKVQWVSEEVDREYLNIVVERSIYPERDLKIIFSPLHGVGLTNAHAALVQAGFQETYKVESQCEPSGDFPAVKNHKPNPEEPAAMEDSLQLGREKGADIALVTDPDADRLGVGVNTGDGWVLLTGNQVGTLICYHLLATLKEKGELTEGGTVMKTLPTSGILQRIGSHFGADCIDNLLVGFKYIAHNMEKMAETGKGELLFGTEESLGYLLGMKVRDKDGAMAALAVAEIAAHLKGQGKTLVDGLNDIYREFGYFKNILRTFYLPGASGREQIKALMATLRNDPPREFGGMKVVMVEDHLELTKRDMESDVTMSFEREFTGDMLVFYVRRESGSQPIQFVLRPSGTEPKVKCYLEISTGTNLEDLESAQRDVDGEAEKVMDGIFASLQKVIDGSS